MHVDDSLDLLARKLVKDDDVINAIQKLGFEACPQFFEHRVAHLLLVALSRLYLTRAQIRSHDQNGVLKVDRPAFGIGQPAVIQDLQQHIEDVWMSLFYLVKEHY